MPADPTGTLTSLVGERPPSADAATDASDAATVFTEVGSGSPPEPAYLKASNPGGPSAGEKTGDHFGLELALSGDTLAVGAPHEDSDAEGVNGDQTDNSMPNSGAVYVFRRSGTTWSQEAYLKGSDPGGVRAQFGAALALDGDTLAVGAFGSSGAVYVFTREGSRWTQQAYLKASNAAAFDWFGRALALAGDTLAVGAPWEDSGAIGVNGNQADNGVEDSGAVYVFTRSGTTWTQRAYIKASNPGESDGFGTRVGLSGDTLAVGAPGEDSSATGVNRKQADEKAPAAGAVYVFTGAGSTWTQQAYVKASNSEGLDDFGYSLALSGDTLVVGSHSEDSSATGVNGKQADNHADYSGAAYVFTRKAAKWAQEAYLKASNTGEGDTFGESVALSADRVVVGAPVESSSATSVNGDQQDEGALMSGAAYIFERTGTTWAQVFYLKASNTQAHDGFGSSVAFFDDTVVVGAPREDSSAAGLNGEQWDNRALDSGAVYVFRR